MGSISVLKGAECGVALDGGGGRGECCLFRAWKARTRAGPAERNPGSHHTLGSLAGLVLQGDGNVGKDTEVTSLL